MKLFILFVMFVSLLFASVDMNNANAKKFRSLKGVGTVKSKAIVAYRDTHGCFTNLNALLNVKGIGPKTLDKNRSELILGKCKK